MGTELIRKISSIENLQDELLNNGGSGGCCAIGNHELEAGTLELPEPTALETNDAEGLKVDIDRNLEKRIAYMLDAPELKAEDVALMAALADDGNIGLSTSTGLGVAFLNCINTMTASQETNPYELSYLVRAKKIIEASSEPKLCESELTSIALIGYNTFEDYGEAILEQL